MKQKKKIICAGAALVLLLTCVCGADAAVVVEPKNKLHQTTDMLFSVGSVSKIYVTAAAMQLADQGKLDLLFYGRYLVRGIGPDAHSSAPSGGFSHLYYKIN